MTSIYMGDMSLSEETLLSSSWKAVEWLEAGTPRVRRGTGSLKTPTT